MATPKAENYFKKANVKWRPAVPEIVASVVSTSYANSIQ